MSNETIVRNLQTGIRVMENQEMLWLKNKGMIAKIVNKTGVKDQYMKEDLNQQGFIGLLNAAHNYQDDGTANFHTYSIPFIHGAVYSYINSCSTFHIPTYMRTRIGKLRQIREEASLQGIRLSDDDICTKLGISKKALDHTIETEKKLTADSLDELMRDYDDKTLLDTIDGNEDPEQEAVMSVYEKELHDTLMSSLDILDGTTKEMIKCVYLLGFSLTKVGKMMNCSQTNVGRRIDRGFAKIRESDYREDLESFMWEGFKCRLDGEPDTVDEIEGLEVADIMAGEQEDECCLFLI